MADEKTVKSRIYIRHDTEKKWTETNPVLAEGEFGYSIVTSEDDSGKEVTTYVLKIGDGTSKWSEIKYTHIYYNKEDIDNLLAEIETGESNIASRVTTIETTVGTSGGDNGTSTGLIADIEKLQEEVEDESSGLLTIVGDKDSGLVKDVSTLQEEVEAESTGLLAVVGDEKSGLVKDVSTLQEEVEDETYGLLAVVGKEASGTEEATGLIKDIRALEDTVYTNADKTGLQDLISANTDSIEELDKQVNGSSDEDRGIVGQIQALEDTVNGTLEKEYADGLTSRLSTAETTITSQGEDISKLKEEVEGTETTDGLLKEVEGENGEGGLLGRVDTIESALNGDDTSDGLIKEVEGSEGEEYKDGLLSRVSELEKTVDDTDERLSARVEAIETTLNGDGSTENKGLIDEVSTIEDDLEALTTFVGTKSDSTTDPKTEATGIVKDIEDNTTAISTINTALGNKMTTTDVDALFD